MACGAGIGAASYTTYAWIDWTGNGCKFLGGAINKKGLVGAKCETSWMGESEKTANTVESNTGKHTEGVR